MTRFKSERYKPDEADLADLREFVTERSKQNRQITESYYCRIDRLSKCYNTLINKVCPNGTIPEKIQVLLNNAIPKKEIIALLDIELKDLNSLLRGDKYPYLINAWNSQFNRPAIEPDPMEYKGPNIQYFKPTKIAKERMLITKLKEESGVPTSFQKEYQKTRPYTPARLEEAAAYQKRYCKTAEEFVLRLSSSSYFQYSDIAEHCGLSRSCGISVVIYKQSLPIGIVNAINETFGTDYKYMPMESDTTVIELVKQMQIQKTISMRDIHSLLEALNLKWADLTRVFGVSRYSRRTRGSEGLPTEKSKHDIESKLKITIVAP